MRQLRNNVLHGHPGSTWTLGICKIIVFSCFWGRWAFMLLFGVQVVPQCREEEGERRNPGQHASTHIQIHIYPAIRAHTYYIRCAYNIRGRAGDMGAWTP